jgi:uncharacterized membrane protein
VLFFGIASYLFGQMLELILTDLSQYETGIILFFLLGAMIWLYLQYRNRPERGSEYE